MTQPVFKRLVSRLDPLKRLSRQIGFTGIYSKVWRRPVRDLRALLKDGGPIERRRTELGHREMQERAAMLPALPVPALDEGFRVHILTGARFWHQSVYCMASLQIASRLRITPVFYSDGTLDSEISSRLRRVLPWAEFVDDQAIAQRLDQILPTSRFPSLRARRVSYIHLRKLTDIHVFPGTWRLVLDSDLLFYRTPTALLDWFGAPRPMAMQDIKDNYGYPLEYLHSLVDGKIPERFNVGVYGIDSSNIDWERVENWCARQLSDFGASYLQEQGLTAMLLAGATVEMLPKTDYFLMPGIQEGRIRRAVMHHYVDHSKRSYFQFGWREIDARVRSGQVGYATTPAHAPNSRMPVADRYPLAES